MAQLMLQVCVLPPVPRALGRGESSPQLPTITYPWHQAGGHSPGEAAPAGVLLETLHFPPLLTVPRSATALVCLPTETASLMLQ